MGTLGFDSFKTYLKFRFGQNDDLDNVDGTNMYGVWINLAYRDLTERHKFYSIRKRFYFPELETSSSLTTTDGTAYIEAPSDMLFPQEVYDSTNDRYLKFIPWTEYVSKTNRSDTSQEGEATRWTRRSDSDTRYIWFYPTPDTSDETMTLYYRKRITTLTGTSATLIGEEWDEPVLTLAAIKGYSWMNDDNRVTKLREEFMEMVADKMEIYTPEENAREPYFHLDPAYKR